MTVFFKHNCLIVAFHVWSLADQLRTDSTTPSHSTALFQLKCQLSRTYIIPWVTDPQIRKYQLLGLSKQFLKALLMYNSAMLWGGIYLDATWNDQHAIFSHANANLTYNPLILSYFSNAFDNFSLCVFGGGYLQFSELCLYLFLR